MRDKGHGRLKRTWLFAAASGIFQVTSSSRAQPPAPFDFGESSERRVIEMDPAAMVYDDYVLSKKAEAAAMVRWFESRLRMARIEVTKHAVEHKFNQELYTRLEATGGSISEIRLLEAQKQTVLDDFISDQLAVSVEMAEADLAAARARLQALDSVRGQ